jgi:hypothetical protein
MDNPNRKQGDLIMSEFEISFKLDGNEYGDCVILQKYGDNYSIISGYTNKETNIPGMRWCYPQGKDKDDPKKNAPRDKAIPWKINLGNLKSARSILQQALDALPSAPDKLQDGIPALKDDPDIPF